MVNKFKLKMTVKTLILALILIICIYTNNSAVSIICFILIVIIDLHDWVYVVYGHNHGEREALVSCQNVSILRFSDKSTTDHRTVC